MKALLETLLSKFSPDKTQRILDRCVLGTTANGNLEGTGNVDPNLEIHVCFLNDTFTPAQFPTERKVSIVIELFQNKELEKIRGDYFVHLLNTLLIFCQEKDNTEGKKAKFKPWLLFYSTSKLCCELCFFCRTRLNHHVISFFFFTISAYFVILR